MCKDDIMLQRKATAAPAHNDEFINVKETREGE
jgi:hypothetical protein